MHQHDEFYLSFAEYHANRTSAQVDTASSQVPMAQNAIAVSQNPVSDLPPESHLISASHSTLENLTNGGKSGQYSPDDLGPEVSSSTSPVMSSETSKSPVTQIAPAAKNTSNPLEASSPSQESVLTQGANALLFFKRTAERTSEQDAHLPPKKRSRPAVWV